MPPTMPPMRAVLSSADDLTVALAGNMVVVVAFDFVNAMLDVALDVDVVVVGEEDAADVGAGVDGVVGCCDDVVASIVAGEHERLSHVHFWFGFLEQS